MRSLCAAAAWDGVRPPRAWARFTSTEVINDNKFMSRKRYVSPTPPSSQALKTLTIGSKISVNRTFSNQDIDDFAALSGDFNRLHFQPELSDQLQPNLWPSSSSSSSPSPRLVHGMLTASLFSTLFGTHVEGAVHVSQNLQFKAPVYVGQNLMATIHFQRLITKRQSRRAGDGDGDGVRNQLRLLKCRTNVMNVTENQICIDGEAVVLLPVNVRVEDTNQPAS